MSEIHPKIRTDLIIQEIIGKDGTKHFVIKDPITNAFFKVGEPEYFIITSFDGLNTFSDIIMIFKDKFNIDLADKELKAFADQLQEMCFLDNELTKKELLKKQKEASIEKPKSMLGRLIFVKIKAFNPERYFNWIFRYIRPLFTGKFVLLASFFIFISFLISIYNARDIANGLVNMINIQGLVILYLSMFIIGFFHESAHGLTCKYFGGEVREIGFLMIYFQPAFFCNVSDAWLFPERRQRILVSFAGGFFQLFIWSITVIIWRVVAQDILLSKLMLAMMAFSGISSLFNFNPLLRYDGYFMLSDYVEIPNLRQKAKNYWSSLLTDLLRSSKNTLKNISNREKRIYFYYGILSFFYIIFVFGYLLWKAGQLLVNEFGGPGFLIFAAVMVFLFRNIIVSGAKETARFLKRPRPMVITSAVVVILILVAILVPMELRIKGEVTVGAIRSLILKYDNLGYAQLIKYDIDRLNSDKQREVSVFGGDYTTTTLVPLVRFGENVKKGQIIAQLANTETARNISEFSSQLDKTREELAILKLGARPEEVEKARNTVKEYEAKLELSSQNLTRMNEMKKKKVIAEKEWEDSYADSLVWASRANAAKNELDLLLAGSRPEEIRAKEAEISRLEGQLDFHRKQQDLSEIKSSVDGMVMMVDTGEVALEITPLDTLDAQIMISEKDLADIEVNQVVKFKVRGYPALNFYGSIYRIGNKIVYDENADPAIKVACRIENVENILKPGMTGVANVFCGKRKISYLIYRKFFRTIRTEFWDWFDWF